MGLKADIVKALRVSLDKEDSEHLAAEIMDRLPPVYEAAPEMLKCLKTLHRCLGKYVGKTSYMPVDLAACQEGIRAIAKAEGQKS